MSHTIANAVMRDCGLKGERRTLMLCLAFHADDDGLCWPSQKLLASETNCTVRGVRKMMTALIKAGEIALVSSGRGRGNISQYRLSKYTEKAEPTVPLLNDGEKRNVAARKEEPTNTKEERRDVKEERPQRKTSPNTKGITKEDKKTSNGMEIPAELQTPEFLEAWKRFKTHRTEIKKPLRAMGEEMQLRALLEMGPERAVSAINHSIRNGWQGIFEPSVRGQRPSAAPHGPIDYSTDLEQ